MRYDPDTSLVGIGLTQLLYTLDDVLLTNKDKITMLLVGEIRVCAQVWLLSVRKCSRKKVAFQLADLMNLLAPSEFYIY